MTSATPATHITTRFAVLVAAVAATLAVAVPLAQARGDDAGDCSNVQSPSAGWVVVSDDQGVPYLYAVGAAPFQQSCAVAGSASEGADTQTAATLDRSSRSCSTVRSPYPEWVVLNDDQGVPYLYPVGSPFAQGCTTANENASGRR